MCPGVNKCPFDSIFSRIRVLVTSSKQSVATEMNKRLALSRKKRCALPICAPRGKSPSADANGSIWVLKESRTPQRRAPAISCRRVGPRRRKRRRTARRTEASTAVPSRRARRPRPGRTRKTKRMMSCRVYWRALCRNDTIRRDGDTAARTPRRVACARMIRRAARCTRGCTRSTRRNAIDQKWQYCLSGISATAMRLVAAPRSSI